MKSGVASKIISASLKGLNKIERTFLCERSIRVNRFLTDSKEIKPSVLGS
jgi:hypothetical protein